MSPRSQEGRLAPNTTRVRLCPGSCSFGLFLAAAAEDPLIRAAIAGSGEMLLLLTTQGQP